MLEVFEKHVLRKGGGSALISGLFQYGRWYRKKHTAKNDEGEGKEWASGEYGAVYQGPGVKESQRNMWREEREAGRSW